MSARDVILQVGFVLIATGAAIAMLAIFPGPWRTPPPVVEEEEEAPAAEEAPEKVIERKAARKAARPRKKAPSSPRKAAR